MRGVHAVAGGSLAGDVSAQHTLPHWGGTRHGHHTIPNQDDRKQADHTKPR